MRYLTNMLLAIYNIKLTIGVNWTIYYLQRLPLIGKRIPDRLYGDSELKMIATVIVTIAAVIRKFAGQFLYIGLMIVLPIAVLFKDIPRTDRPEAFVQMFFFLSFLAGTIQKSVLLESNRHKYICIKLMRFNARDFLIPTLFSRYTTTFIYFLPAVLFFSARIGGSILQGFLLLILMTALRLIFEATQLRLYDKKKILINKKYLVQWLVILPSLAAAYVPFVFHTVWPITGLLFSLPAVILLLAAAAWCTRYILKFPGYKRVVASSLRLDDIQIDISKVKSEALFSSVKMKENEFSGESLRSGKHEKKKGYEYLNAIFFDRHRKLLEKPMIFRLGMIGVVLAALVAFSMFFPGVSGKLDNRLLTLMPFFVFIMYSISLGDRICKAMFYNCDISLLRYNFYRYKDVILRNFMVRLRKVAAINLIVGAAVCAALYIFVAAAGISVRPLDLILFTVSILCLSAFFSVHHLFLYYVFQPYTTELGVKNPYFKFINTLVYLLCFFCLQLKNAPGYFTLVVISATIMYTTAALILVYRLAPRNFRVK